MPDVPCGLAVHATSGGRSGAASLRPRSAPSAAASRNHPHPVELRSCARGPDQRKAIEDLLLGGYVAVERPRRTMDRTLEPRFGASHYIYVHRLILDLRMQCLDSRSGGPGSGRQPAAGRRLPHPPPGHQPVRPCNQQFMLWASERNQPVPGTDTHRIPTASWPATLCKSPLPPTTARHLHPKPKLW
jgi:hypothetical protein